VVERLPEVQSVAVGRLGQLGAVVAGGEGERHAAFTEGLGDRRRPLRPEVHVEDCEVRLFAVEDRKGLRDARRRTYYGTAEFNEHLLDLHGDQQLVLHDQNAGARPCPGDVTTLHPSRFLSTSYAFRRSGTVP
jgi:hypothetical protein